MKKLKKRILEECMPKLGFSTIEKYEGCCAEFLSAGFGDYVSKKRIKEKIEKKIAREINSRSTPSVGREALYWKYFKQEYEEWVKKKVGEDFSKRKEIVEEGWKKFVIPS